MIPLQVRLETLLTAFPAVTTLMQERWAWPLVESAHFIGLTLLFGAIAVWDLRLVGLLRQGSLTALHRLVPCAIVGFAVNAATGLLFLLTYPDQYVYNTAFHVKMLAVGLAGVNVAVFYAAAYRPAAALPPDAPLPPTARACGAISLALWVTVIVAGRMITFFRPSPCGAGDLTGFIADCIVR
jgi:hypothetical protein